MNGLVTGTLCFVFIVATAASCHAGGGLKGSGTVVVQERPLPEFNHVHLTGFGDVYLRQGSPQSVTVRADDNILPIVETEVRNAVLTISTTERVQRVTALEVRIVMDELRGLAVSGAGDIRGEDPFVLEDLNLSISGAGNIALECRADRLEATISGAGDIVLSGEAGTADFSISGAGDLKASDLVARQGKVVVSGAGDCRVHVLDELDVRVSGAGDVHYKGDPVVRRSVSGAGSVRKVDG